MTDSSFSIDRRLLSDARLSIAAARRSGRDQRAGFVTGDVAAGARTGQGEIITILLFRQIELALHCPSPFSVGHW